MRVLLLLIAVVPTGLAQQRTQLSLDKPARAAVIEALAAKLNAGYVLPDSSQGIIQASWNWPFDRKDLEIYGRTGYVLVPQKDLLRVRIVKGIRTKKKGRISISVGIRLACCG